MNTFSGLSDPGRVRGSATVELLVIMPVLLMTLAIGIDEARMMRAAVALDSAVQMGVLAGVIKLKNNGFDKEDLGPVIVHADVLTAMTNTAIADAADYTIQVTNASYLCRCPDPTTFMVGNLVSCAASSINSCKDPQIYLQMTATTQVDMMLFVPGANPHLTITRSASMCGH